MKYFVLILSFFLIALNSCDKREFILESDPEEPQVEDLVIYIASNVRNETALILLFIFRVRKTIFPFLLEPGNLHVPYFLDSSTNIAKIKQVLSFL